MATNEKCECSECEEEASAGWQGKKGFGFCFACDEAGCRGDGLSCRCRDEEAATVNAAEDAKIS